MMPYDKKLDMEIRDNVIENLKVALRQYKKTGEAKWKEFAEFFGKESLRLKVKIATYDYKNL